MLTPDSSADAAAHADPMIGELLGGRYLVERLIDRGGMGLVYMATEAQRERPVVIKMLAPHCSRDVDAVARFDREGNRLAQLQHPNIVELYDVGRAAEKAFIAMEYIHGEPLRRYLKRKGRLDVREFCPLAAQISSAVAHAHAHGIMLRDIKPSNIMLCEHGGKANFVKLLDFGLAKLVHGDDVDITNAHVMGTAAYLSPEQIKGEPIDVRVDVYALGVLFFEMLAGQSPIVGDNDAALLYNHVHGAPLQLEAVLPKEHDVPQALIDLVQGCLFKDACLRPADAGDLSRALAACVPREMFALPEATAESRALIRAYHEAKLASASQALALHIEGVSSSEWTRPVGKPSGIHSRADERHVSPRANVFEAPCIEGTSPAQRSSRRSMRKTGPRKVVRKTLSWAVVSGRRKARSPKTHDGHEHAESEEHEARVRFASMVPAWLTRGTMRSGIGTRRPCSWKFVVAASLALALSAALICVVAV